MTAATDAAAGTTAAIDEIKQRQAALIERVLDKVREELHFERDEALDETYVQAIETAMLELSKGWREEAAWWVSAKRRGSVSTSAQLNESASRISAFAVALRQSREERERATVRPHEPIAHMAAPPVPSQGESATTETGDPPPAAPTLTQPPLFTELGGGSPVSDLVVAARDEIPLGGTITVGGIEFTKIGEDPFTSPKQPPAPTGDPLMDFFTGAAPTYQPPARPEQVLAATAQATVDSPFAHPGPPGMNRRPVAHVPFQALGGLATSLEAAHPRVNVSHTFVSRYQECGLSALLTDASHAELIGPQRPSWSLIGGSAFHLAVEAIEMAVLGKSAERPPKINTDEDIEAYWNECLNLQVVDYAQKLHGTAYGDPTSWHVANGGKEGYDFWRVQGAAMLKTYIHSHGATFRSQNPVLMLGDTPAIEMPYEMTVRSLDLTAGLVTKGYIDCVRWDVQRDAFVIVDYKTGRNAPSGTFQLGEYAHALIMLLGQRLQAPPPETPVLGRYWLARKGEYTEPVDLLKAHPLGELQYRYDTAWRGAKLGIFPPNQTNMCSSCGVRDYCPVVSGR